MGLALFLQGGREDEENYTDFAVSACSIGM